MDAAADPLNVAALEKSLNEASSKFNGLWISFCLFLTYVAITTGSVTHRQLFLNSPIEMPVLAVNVPMLGFFIISPILLLLFHFNVLAQISAFAQKAQAYDAALIDKVPLVADRRLFRQRIDLSMLPQAFLGSDSTSYRATVFVARLAMLSTTVLAPIVLLLLSQLMFLPYQSEPVTWTHRVVIIADLLLMLLLWPAAFLVPDASKSRRLVTRFTLGTIAVAIAGFSLLVAVAPEESLYPAIKNRITSALFERNEGAVEALSIPMFSNRLYLQNEVLLDPAKIGDTENSISVNGRSFRYIQLRGSDLRRADFRGSDLSHADLSFARLAEANFACIGGAGRDFSSATRETLRSSNFGCTLLRDATLDEAQLQGAILVGTIAERASFRSANLVGARFSAAQLIGANFDFASMQGSFFEKTNLVGASFYVTQLQGARIAYSDLLAANLQLAQLQGATLYASDLQAADMRGAYMQLAHFQVSELLNTDVQDISYVYGVLAFDLGFRRRDPDKVDRILNILRKEAVESYSNVSERIEVLESLEQNPETAAFWARIENEALERGYYRKELIDLLVGFACSTKNAPYVARGLIHHRFSYPNDEAGVDKDAVIARLRDDNCKGAKGLSEEDWRALDTPVGGV